MYADGRRDEHHGQRHREVAREFSAEHCERQEPVHQPEEDEEATVAEPNLDDPRFNELFKSAPPEELDALMDAAYDDQVYVDDRTIDSHIKRLRKKFKGTDDDFDMIETLYGVGYRFKET